MCLLTEKLLEYLRVSDPTSETIVGDIVIQYE